MTLLDVMGHFWLATNPGLQVAGRLIIDEENNAQLELIDSLYELADAFRFSAQPVRILGISSGKILTIDRCFRAPLSGIFGTNEKYSSSLVLEGAHFNENEVMDFNFLTLKPNYLEQWVGMTGVRPDGDSREFSLEISQTESMQRDIEGGEISLDFYTWYSGEVLGDKAITDSCAFRVNFLDRSPLERFFGTVSILQDLVTLGVGKPASILHAYLGQDDTKNSYKLYAHWRARTNRNNSQTIAPHSMLFTFRDIGGIDGVSAWMANAARFNSVIAPLRGYWYIPDLDVETRLIILCIAAESLDKVLTGKSSSKMKTRIKRVAKSVERILSSIDNMDRWIDDIYKARNEFVHHDSILKERKNQFDFVHLYFLEELLYFLIILCMLQSCGISGTALVSVQQNARFRGILAHLREYDLTDRIPPSNPA